MFNNFRYQIYHRQDDLETAQFLATRCGSKSGFAHSKTEHETGVSTGESEQKIPVITAQYIMYDMPDDEILGFWGKRPFLGKRIPGHPKSFVRKPADVPAPRLLPGVSSYSEPEIPQRLPSWRTDATLLRHSFATSESAPQT
jgi:hypothetical protein